MIAKTDNSGWDNFIKLCQRTKNKRQLRELFDFLFTPEEKEHLAMRILLVRELLKGEKTQREIAQILNISIAKITRGSNNLKHISDSLRKYLTSQIL